MTKTRLKSTQQLPQKVRQIGQVGGVMLADIASMLGWIFTSRPIGMGWAEYEDRQARRIAYEEREYLRQLKQRKFIETKRIGQKLMVRLTAKGWQQVLRDKIRFTKNKCKEGICLVIFDIPESERHVRDTLRGLLCDLGFEMIQKSVWATEKDVLKNLCALLQGANLYQWVRIIQGREIQSSFVRRAFVRLPVVARPKKYTKNNACLNSRS